MIHIYMFIVGIILLIISFVIAIYHSDDMEQVVLWNKMKSEVVYRATDLGILCIFCFFSGFILLIGSILISFGIIK